MSSSWNESVPRLPDGRVDVDRVFREGFWVDRAMRAAFRDTCFRHKALGYPLIVYENGKTVEIPPEDIVVPDEDYIITGKI